MDTIPKSQPEQPAAPAVRVKRKYKKRKFITPKQWGHLRALYELGEYSLIQLSEDWDVSLNTVQRRSMKDGWSKGAMAAAVQKKAEESAIELFSRLLMPREKRVQLIIDTITSPKVITEVVEIEKDKDGNPIRTKTGRILTVKRSIQADDHDVRLRYIQEANKLCGEYPAPKSPVESKPDPGEGVIPVVSHITPMPRPANVQPNN